MESIAACKGDEAVIQYRPMKTAAQKTSQEYFKWLLVIALILLVGTLFWGIRWATYTRPPLPEAVDALQSDDQVVITFDPWLTFSPVQLDPDTGFIFYPGGRVDSRGYATLTRAIAEAGYLVIVPEMPINMAVFNANIADEIIAYYPNIEYWAIGGHSVGGAMAAQYTGQHPDIIDGLAIWASYPPDSTDISELDIPVVSIYGSQELKVNDASIRERKDQLPADTLYIRIEGGDHHQFGSYLIDPVDHLATISRSSQQQQIIQATLELLATVAK